MNIGTRVSYEDMANPRREGVVVELVGDEYRVRWDEGDEAVSDCRQAGWKVLPAAGAFDRMRADRDARQAAEYDRRMRAALAGDLGTVAQDVARKATQAGRYSVKCDECRADMRRTDSVRESAAGGRCDACCAEARS